ncbi:MAG: metallophosphoesterase [Gammaproteobacteria bacterium]|nr:metallophosphoesterase [Gammaproteobacteria bacterium]MDH5801767.1 metallophosphoesterase [Gammaproteobacteria bacterium]
MNRVVQWLLSVGIVVVILAAVMLPLRVEIVAPRLGIPVIRQPSQSFEVELQSSIPFYLPYLALSLESAAGSVPLEIKSMSVGVLRHRLQVSLPQNIQAGMYTLQAQGRWRSYKRPNAVTVVQRFKPELSLVQLADLPVLGGDGSGDALLRQIIGEINIINPDLVLFTGDLAYGGSWDQYNRLLDAMLDFATPVIAVPGNHEYEGWGAYLKLLGQPYHVVSYGGYHIVSLNSGHGKDQLTHSQYAWFQNTLASLPEQAVPLLQIHHPLHHKPGLRGYLQVHVDDVVAQVKQAGIPVVLSGHWHGDAVYDELGRERTDTWRFDGTPYVVTTTAGADLRPPYSSSPLHHGYRLLRLRQGELQFYTYDYDGDGKRDASSSLPTGLLSLRHISNTHLVVENQLNETFVDAKVVFHVPGDNPNYVPSIGRLLDYMVLADKVRFEVLLDLPARSDTTVTLEPR